MDLELADRVRRVIDTNSYMALGTTDERTSLVSPVWYVSEDYLNFLWVDRVSQEEIGNGWVLDDVQGSALFRLYRARISEHWMLIRGGDPERGSGVDRSGRGLLELT